MMPREHTQMSVCNCQQLKYCLLKRWLEKLCICLGFPKEVDEYLSFEQSLVPDLSPSPQPQHMPIILSLSILRVGTLPAASEHTHLPHSLSLSSPPN